MSVSDSSSATGSDTPGDPMDLFWERLVGIDGDHRRAYPRVQVDSPVTLCVNDGTMQARLHDIGRGGLQIRCDRATGASIAPGSSRQRTPIRVDVALPDGDSRRLLSTRCLLAHVTIIGTGDAAGEVAMGFRFEPLEPSAAQVLEWFIVKALEPAPV